MKYAVLITHVASALENQLTVSHFLRFHGLLLLSHLQKDVRKQHKQQILNNLNALEQASALVGMLVYHSSSLGWSYGANKNPASRRQPD